MKITDEKIKEIVSVLPEPDEVCYDIIIVPIVNTDYLFNNPIKVEPIKRAIFRKQYTKGWRLGWVFERLEE